MGKTEEPKSTWRERKKEIKHKWLIPFIYVEWLCERLSYRLGRWAFLDILGHIGRFSVITSVVIGISVYWWEAPEREKQAENQRKAKHYQAWQVINAAYGKRSNSGRIDALKDLNEDGVSLMGTNLSNAYLPNIELIKSDLRDANLSGANLDNAEFSGADLRLANFSGARLRRANLSAARLSIANFSESILLMADLSEAILIETNLSGANLGAADLSGAELNDANLSGAALGNANFSRATLLRANLSGADLLGANLSRANLKQANLKNIRKWEDVNSIELANIYGVINEPNGFIEWAKENGALEIEDRDKWQAILKMLSDKTPPRVTDIKVMNKKLKDD